jgi:hypothetical protein
MQEKPAHSRYLRLTDQHANSKVYQKAITQLSMSLYLSHTTVDPKLLLQLNYLYFPRVKDTILLRKSSNMDYTMIIRNFL